MKKFSNKYVGACKVGEKGQIVIPKEIREMFEIMPGDTIIILANKNKGIAIVKADVFDSVTENILGNGVK